MGFILFFKIYEGHLIPLDSSWIQEEKVLKTPITDKPDLSKEAGNRNKGLFFPQNGNFLPRRGSINAEPFV